MAREQKKFAYLDGETRRRLSVPNLSNCFEIAADYWKIKDEDANRLLGLDEESAASLRKDPQARPLTRDEFTRVSRITSIFGHLHMIHHAELANRWISLPNSKYNGKSTLQHMLEEGPEAMRIVNCEIVAIAAGN